MKSLCGKSEDFCVRIGVHQDSVLSTYLFDIVKDEIMKDIQCEKLKCMLFVNNIVLIRERTKELKDTFEEWKAAHKGKKLRISWNESKYIEIDFDSGEWILRMNRIGR